MQSNGSRSQKAGILWSCAAATEAGVRRDEEKEDHFEPDKHDWYFPSSHHYQLQSEFPLGMTAEQFYNALQEEPVESVLNGTPLKNGELIEIDDGLASHFFYCYSQSTVLPAKVFGLEHEGGAHHA